jgi:class 3 adenylate cyclase/pimeloyl-ACP methyl ester carboxylesterase
VDAPEAQYLDRDGALLAYQVVGNGSANVLWVGEAAQHFDLAWTDPDIHAAYERAAAYSRSVYMQMRGLGLSDPIRYWPTLEQQADDVLAVLDAAGMRRATLAAQLTTCGAVTLVAAKAPERVAGLVLLKPLVCGPLAPAAAELGWTPESAAEYAAGWRDVMARWGSGATLEMWDPVLATPYNRRLMALLERCSAKPAFAQMYVEAGLSLDYSDLFPAVQAPTRVLHTPTANEPIEIVRRVADLIPNATFHELPRTLPGASIGQTYDVVWRHVREMATGFPASSDAERFLGTVLFTDLVGSTELLARVGDARYRDLRAAHERQVRLHVEEADGRLLNVIGDGTISLFDGPTRAVRAAVAISADAAGMGVQVRAGVHTGELEHAGHDVTGMSVHIGARISALAAPGEVLVSSTVRDLVVGSGLDFVDRGTHELKGVPGSWSVFALAGSVDRPAELPAERSLETALDRAALRTARTAPGATRAAIRLGNAMQRYRARVRSRDLAR